MPLIKMFNSNVKYLVGHRIPSPNPSTQEETISVGTFVKKKAYTTMYERNKNRVTMAAGKGNAQ